MAEEKYVLKKRQNAMGSIIQANKLEEHGIKPSKNSKKKSAVKLGRCPACGKIAVRFNVEVTHAVCTCKSAVEMPLTVVITRDRYNDAKKLAKEMEADGDGDRKRLLQGLLNDVFEIESLEE